MLTVGDRRWVEYHSSEWKLMTETGWVTVHADVPGSDGQPRQAFMLYYPDDGKGR